MNKLIINGHEIPFTLLFKYVSTIASIRCNLAVGLMATKVLGALDLLRTELHDDILACAGTSRNDNKFGFELATLVKSCLGE